MQLDLCSDIKDLKVFLHVLNYGNRKRLVHFEFFSSSVSTIFMNFTSLFRYKILFLDVLFPLDVKKIIFVDADQVYHLLQYLKS